MKKKIYTQKQIKKIGPRRGIFINNNKLQKKEILVGSGNKLLLTIGIVAKRNKKITQEQINTIKQDLHNIKSVGFGGKITKYFEIIIKKKPNKVITSKGILVRMGKGKGKIKTKAIYLLKDIVCIELKQKDINNKKIINLINSKNKEINIKNIFTKFIKKHRYFTIKSNLKI